MREIIKHLKKLRSYADEKDSGHGCAWRRFDVGGPEPRRCYETGTGGPDTASGAATIAGPRHQCAPVIKDPAEYNAYVGAVQQTDPAAKISGLEAFLTQYPNSVMKTQALEILMGAYQGTNNQQKTIGAAKSVGRGRSDERARVVCVGVFRSADGAERRSECEAIVGGWSEIWSTGIG